MGAKTMLTVEQFEQLPETEGVSFELDEGELIEVPSAILDHNDIRDKLVFLVRLFIAAKPGRGFAVSEQDFRLAKDTVRRPDLAFISPENLGRLDRQRSIQQFAPDLAIEVTSPSDTLKSLNRKTKQYLKAGTKAVWLVVPEMREVHIHSTDARPRILTADENLEDPTLLPGFAAPVASLFED